MIFKKKPYYEQEGMRNYIIVKILTGLRPIIPNNFSNSIITKLLKKCWDSDSKLRPSMNEVIKELKLAISFNQEDSTSQYELGNCYENGIGVEKDINEAYKW